MRNNDSRKGMELLNVTLKPTQIMILELEIDHKWKNSHTVVYPIPFFH